MNPAPASAVTSRFLSVSIAIGVSSGLPPCSAIKPNSALNPVAPVSILDAPQLQTLLVQQRDVVVRLGPVNPAGDTHPILLVLGNRCVELEAVRRPDMGQRSVARHLTSRSRTSWRTGRVTVYVRDLVTCPCHHMQ